MVSKVYAELSRYILIISIIVVELQLFIQTRKTVELLILLSIPGIVPRNNNVTLQQRMSNRRRTRIKNRETKENNSEMCVPQPTSLP